MTKEDIEKLSADVVENDNGWYTIDIYYDGKPIKRVHQ